MENPFLSFLTDSEVMSQHCASSFETNPSASTLSLRAKHVVVADMHMRKEKVSSDDAATVAAWRWSAAG